MPLILPCLEVFQVRELSNACLQLLLKIFELYLFMSSTFLRPSPGIQVNKEARVLVDQQATLASQVLYFALAHSSRSASSIPRIALSQSREHSFGIA